VLKEYENDVAIGIAKKIRKQIDSYKNKGVE
jgi:hypothetical protein